MYAVIQIKAEEQGQSVKKITLESPYLTLQQLYKWTGCECIEIVRSDHKLFEDIINPFEDILIVLDDNGKIDHRPFNDLGTTLYGQFPYDFLVGDLVLTTSARPMLSDDPDAYAMTEEQADKVMKVLISIINKMYS